MRAAERRCACLAWLRRRLNGLGTVCAPAADRPVHSPSIAALVRLQLLQARLLVAPVADRCVHSQAREQSSPAFPAAHLPTPCHRVLLPLQWTMLP